MKSSVIVMERCSVATIDDAERILDYDERPACSKRIRIEGMDALRKAAGSAGTNQVIAESTLEKKRGIVLTATLCRS